MRFSRSLREGPVRGARACGLGDGTGSFLEAHPLSSRVVASKTKPVRTFHYSLHAPRPGGIGGWRKLANLGRERYTLPLPLSPASLDSGGGHSSRSPGDFRCRLVAARRRLASSLAAL